MTTASRPVVADGLARGRFVGVGAQVDDDQAAIILRRVGDGGRDHRSDLLVQRHDRDPWLRCLLLAKDEGQQPRDDDGRDEEQSQRAVVAAQLLEQPPADGQRPTRPHGCSPADAPCSA
jgi:hypothetical protein